jgi:TIR domain
VKPGERVVLIEAAADSLAMRPFPRAQMILEQFGIETYDLDATWQGAPDEPSYVLQQISKASDEALTSLHAFLVGDDAEPEADPMGGPWRTDLPARVFLSHQHANRLFVGQVKAVLADRFGADAFVAHDDITPSKEWRSVIKFALDSCHALAAFLDASFHQSQWCDQEVGWALGRGVPIIPIRERSLSRDLVGSGGFLDEHQEVPVEPGWDNRPSPWTAAEGVFRVLVTDPRTRGGVRVKTLAEAFVRSASYDTTRKLWAMIEAVPHLESDQLRRLEYAVQTNDQVYNAVARGQDGQMTNVTLLVQRLVERFEPPVEPLYDPNEEPF